MTAPTSKNAPHLGAESSYGPTHAAPDGDASRSAPAAATDADTEVDRWQHSHGRSDRPQAQAQPPSSPGPAHNPAATLERLPEVLTVGRYAARLRDHVRPHIGTRLLRQLETLEIQAIYDHLLVAGRKDGKPGGLAPQHILAVHRCLHRALEQAVTWGLVDRNAAKHASPPPVPQTEVAALTPEQVDLLLAAAAVDPKPWLGAWTVLAAASGARNGELCGLEWSDLDLDAGTVRFRQALTNLETAHLPATTPAAV